EPLRAPPDGGLGPRAGELDRVLGIEVTDEQQAALFLFGQACLPRRHFPFRILGALVLGLPVFSVEAEHDLMNVRRKLLYRITLAGIVRAVDVPICDPVSRSKS